MFANCFENPSPIDATNPVEQVVNVKMGAELLRQGHGEHLSTVKDKDKSMPYWHTPYFWGILQGKVLSADELRVSC